MTTNEKALVRRVKKNIKAKQHIFFAVTRPGFELETMEEIQNIIGIKAKNVAPGGIEFSAKIEDMWKLHLLSFTITSIKIRIASFRAGTIGEAIKKIKLIDWAIYLPYSSLIEVDSKLKKCLISDGSTLERIIEREIGKKMIADKSKKPRPVSSLFLRGIDNHYQLSLDCSGKRFFSRGYREFSSNAPIRETTASLILQATKYNNYNKLIDPMCGCGSFSLEFLARNYKLLPGENRKFPFMQWPSFRDATWNNLLQQAKIERQSNKNRKLTITTSDIDIKMVEATNHNIEKLKESLKTSGIKSDFEININQTDFFKLELADNYKEKSLMLLNPQYGKRLKNSDTIKLYENIGKILNSTFKNIDVAVIAPIGEAEKALKLETSRRIEFQNGGIKVALLVRAKKIP